MTVMPVEIGFCGSGRVSVWPGGAVSGGLGGQVVFVELEEVVRGGN